MIKIKKFQILILFFLFSNFTSLKGDTNEETVKTERSGYWTYYCKNHEEKRHCEIARKIEIKEQKETFLIIYKITKDRNSRVKENLNIFTPLRVDKKKKLKLSFDEKTKFTRSFSKCNDLRCLAVFKNNILLKYSLKNFQKIRITFHVTEEADPISLTLPIEGFKEALITINKQLEFY